MSNTQWTFIGAGNMASSLIGGLIGSGSKGEHITVVDINNDACLALQNKFGVNSLNDVSQIPAGASIVIAVKPHIVESICKTLSSTPPALVISVAAGVLSNSIAQWINTPTAIVRCMPNTPALLGLGATALFANEHCSKTHKEEALAMLTTAGIAHWVEDEAKLDAITALSGSGPAYFFYVIEHMINAAVSLGLPETVARDFAIETAFGAASMAREKTDTPKTLRENVTSKGGTTAAAINTFDQHKLDETIKAAMQAAHDRAVELGKAE